MPQVRRVRERKNRQTRRGGGTHSQSRRGKQREYGIGRDTSQNRKREQTGRASEQSRREAKAHTLFCTIFRQCSPTAPAPSKETAGERKEENQRKKGEYQRKNGRESTHGGRTEYTTKRTKDKRATEAMNVSREVKGEGGTRGQQRCLRLWRRPFAPTNNEEVPRYLLHGDRCSCRCNRCPRPSPSGSPASSPSCGGSTSSSGGGGGRGRS